MPHGNGGNMHSTPADGPHSLARGLGLVSAGALIITNVIGTGVFLKARVMVCNVETPAMVLLVYALAGAFTVAGALTFAELGTLMPRAGGQYNFMGAAFGRVWAFLFGWTSTFVDGAASCAVQAIVMVIFLNDLLGGGMAAGHMQLLSVAAIVGVTLIAIASVHSNGVFASVVTGLKILLVAGIGVAAFLYGNADWGHFLESGAGGSCEGVPDAARSGLAGFGAAMVGALWSYNGWNAGVLIAEEIRDPKRNLPRAIVGGVLVVVLLYVFVNAAYFRVLSPEEVGGVGESSSVAGSVLVRLLGGAGAAIIAAGMMISTTGTLHGTALAVARVPFAMARDGLLPSAFAAVSPRSKAPTVAVAVIGICAIAYALTGTFDLITDLVVFILLIFHGMSVAAVYVLRRAMPDAPRPYRMWGYPVVPALFLVATLFLMVNTLLTTSGRALIGIAIVAAGLPVYYYYARRLPADRRENWIGEAVPD